MKHYTLSKYASSFRVKNYIHCFFMCLLFFAISFSYSSAGNQQMNSEKTPQDSFQEGSRAFEKGDFQLSYTLLNEALPKFTGNGDLKGQCDCQILLAHVCMSIGHTERAGVYLKDAESTALKIGNQILLARIYALRGNLEHISGNPDAALNNMKKALSMAEKNGCQELLISIHNDLGNLFGALQEYPKALDAYQASAALAEKKGDAIRSAIALTNGAKICLTDGDRYLNDLETESNGTGINDFLPVKYNPPENKSEFNEETGVIHRSRGTILSPEETNYDRSLADPKKAGALFGKACSLLDQARTVLKNAGISQHRTTAHINIGLAYMDLAERLPDQSNKILYNAAGELSNAVESARGCGDTRLLSYALGYMGRLHQKEGQLSQAVNQTIEAIYWAGKTDTPESLYRWQWQRAEIFAARDNPADAVTSYQQAITTLESIRSEFGNCYGQPRADLRKAENELYQMYVDVLLRYAHKLGPIEQQEILKTARQAVEKRKVFELREYFKDDCLGASITVSTNVDEIQKNAVVIYPVLFPDRMEIIASFSSQPGTGDDANHGKPAKSFCKTYVIPVESTAIIKTVNSFRNTLMLKTSQHYLPYAAQLYNWLIRPLEQDLKKSKADTLVFIPESALSNIPMGALYDGSSYLIQSYAVAVAPGLELADPAPLNSEKINILAAGISSQTRGFEPLPGVAEELNSISSFHKATVLMDGQFSLTNFEHALKNDDFNVVHIASHGKFSDTIENSFILAADKRITFNDLANYVGLYRFRKQPLELLTLSACETATGNDKAALGLAGIAVKVGARSALATLWAVDDQAAAQLVSEFYRQIREPGVSRAKALKMAKQKLLADPEYGHPGYWSPFILINNWL